ncbi:hypothetical protein [Leptodesmis sp.]
MWISLRLNYAVPGDQVPLEDLAGQRSSRSPPIIVPDSSLELQRTLQAV